MTQFSGLLQLADTIASIHWLSLTFWQPSPQHDIIPSVLDKLHLSSFIKRGNVAGRGYRQILFGEFEAKLYQFPYDSRHGEHFHLELTGDVCNFIEPAAYVSLFQWLQMHEVRFQVTRLDVALDTQVFDTNMIAQSVFENKIRTRVHRDNISRFHNLTGSADTLYFGSPSSDTRLRIYKKRVFEFIGQKDDDWNKLTLPEQYSKDETRFSSHPVFGVDYFTRVELQLRDVRANHLFMLFALQPIHDWVLLMASSINDFVSIQENYWASWLTDVPQGSLLKIKTPPKSIQKTTKWLHHQVAASLAMYIQALSGGAYNETLIRELIDYGRLVMGDGHKRVITEHKLAENVSDAFSFVGLELEQMALEPASGSLDLRPLRNDFYNKLEQYPFWYKKFIEQNAQFASARPSNFEFMLGIGWVLDLDKYSSQVDVLNTEKPELPAHQYELPLINDAARKRVNHYDY